ncbi:sugar MFS transporter [Leifsonia sp. EB34]|uniref:MFS transporter n=1 Tax=Leifsonia sp. EB34 TaxID=3156303 RepID=UPI003514A69C
MPHRDKSARPAETFAHRRVRVGFVLSQVFFGLATSLFDMFYPLYLGSVGVNAEGAGLVFSVGFAVMALAVMPMSLAAARVGVQRFMLVSSFGFGLTMLLVPFLVGLTSHLVVFAVNSVCAAVMLVAVNSVVGRAIRDDGQRFSTFTAGFLAFLAASAVGNLLGVALARWGGGGALERTALVAAGLLALGVGASRVLMRDRPDEPGGLADDVRGGRGWPRLVRENRVRLGHLMMVALFVGGAGVLAIRFLSIVAVEYFGMDEEGLGWLLVGDRIASFFGLFVLAPLMKRRDPFRVAGVVMIVALILQILSAGASIAAVYAIWYLSRQGLHYSQMPVLDHAANLDTPATGRTIFNGTQRMGIYLGSALGSLAYGALIARDLFGWAMILSGVFAALAGVGYLFRPAIRRAS